MCVREGKGFGDEVERERDLGRGEVWKDNTKKKKKKVESEASLRLFISFHFC